MVKVTGDVLIESGSQPIRAVTQKTAVATSSPPAARVIGGSPLVSSAEITK